MSASTPDINDWPLVILAKAASYQRLALYAATGGDKPEHYAPALGALKLLLEQVQDEIKEFEASAAEKAGSTGRTH